MPSKVTEFDKKKATVARSAYFGGLLVGGLILALGLFGVSRLDLGWVEIPLEMAVVAIAMVTTSAIWKRSAIAELDSPSEPRDRTMK